MEDKIRHEMHNCNLIVIIFMNLTNECKEEKDVP